MGSNVQINRSNQETGVGTLLNSIRGSVKKPPLIGIYINRSALIGLRRLPHTVIVTELLPYTDTMMMYSVEDEMR